MKRKVMAIVLSLCIGMTVLAGCGNTSTDASETSETAETETTVAAAHEVETIEVTTFEMPTASEESDIYVEPIENLADDFICGMDASSVLAEENSGVKYYNYDGEEQDVFMTLAQSGVNYIRIRVWNDPYDENGNGYGGGNNDLATAIALGKRATQYGMKVQIDFHYSDFWADPKRQHAPKAWEGMNIDEKSDALYEYTVDSLTQLLDAGVNVGMVQIGNEINNGMSGETKTENVMQLLTAGSKAVREVAASYDKDIQIAVHYTNVTSPDEVDGAAANLQKYNIDYDIFGLSYYSYWNGTIENVRQVGQNIMDKYGKKVMIAETSYPYTSEDGDGFDNSIKGLTDELFEGYAATVQSQATMIRDICASANEVGMIGVFYWEGVWVPVGDADADNSAIWEQYGSGWASSYSADYDPEDAGLYYGGCSWDNQAMFDFDGHPLASLNVFKYLRYGATTELAIDYVPDVNVTLDVGAELTLPETVDVIYNDRSANTQVAVTWDAEQVAAIDTSVGSEYEITGVLEDGSEVTCHLEVVMLNHVLNPSFEEEDTSMWTVTYEGDVNPTDYQVKSDDAHEGDTAFHFWSGDSDMEFAIEQELTDLQAGTYQLTVYAQGGDMDDDAAMELYAITSDGEQSEPFMVTSYADWKNPTISDIKVTDGTLTIGVRVKCNVNSWGTMDEFTLNRIGD